MANQVCINGKGWDQWKAEVGIRIGIESLMWEREIFFGTRFDEGEALVKEQLAKINLIQNEAWHVSDGSQRRTKSTSASTRERIRGYFTEPDKSRMRLKKKIVLTNWWPKSVVSSSYILRSVLVQRLISFNWIAVVNKLISLSFLITKSIFIPGVRLILVW